MLVIVYDLVMTNKIINFLLFVVLAGLFITLMLSAVNRGELNECLTWQNEAEQYADYYLTGWQAAQCAAHGVTINAPVI